MKVINLPSLEFLVLYNTEVPGLPPGVLSFNYYHNCLDSLRAHFADLATEAAEMPGVKLLLLGNGGAGKTKIAGWLSGKEFGSDDWDSTHGIEIGETDLPGEPPTRLQIWDFGGQDIYHGAHALFLRSPAVLAAVWATDTEANKTHTYGGLEFRNQPLAYWVEIARQQGHPGSPLLILQSKCDAPEDEVRRLPLPNETPYFKSLQVSAKADRYKAALRDTLAEAVKYLRDPQRMGTVKIGAGRLRVRDRLEAMRAADRALPPDQRRHRLLTMAAFEQICSEEGGVSAPEHLLTWLDADGAVLYRPGLLRDRIVLDQNWALEAVYAVFHRNSRLWSEIRRCNGRFTRSMLDLYVWRDHSAEDQALFLDLMRSCGICFQHREFDQGGEEIVEYIAPDLLPERAEIADRLPAFWDEGRAGEPAIFRYPLLHDGLIRTIVADLGEQAGPDALYWRGGLCGYEATTGSRFLIEQHRSDPESWSGEIHVSTQVGRAADLLARLVEHVERAQNRFGLRPETVERPAIRSPSPHSKDDKPEMRFIPPPRPPAEDRWYVSYAWGDKTPEGREREKIVDDLCAAAADAGRTILRDKNVLSFGDSISGFMRQIGAGDRVFVILSDKYLRSPYCMFELSEIWRTSLRQETFLERVRVYALPDAKIWDPRDWADWAIHWKKEYEALDSRAREHGAAVLGQRGNDRLRQMQYFYTSVADILGTLADIVQPRTFEELKRYGLDDKPAS